MLRRSGLLACCVVLAPALRDLFPVLPVPWLLVQVASLAVAVVAGDGLPPTAKAAAVEGVALGVILGGYEDVRFKSEVSQARESACLLGVRVGTLLQASC
jgi:membrane associated rhomboid family serine protease